MTSQHKNPSFFAINSPQRTESRIWAWLDQEGIFQVSPGDKKRDFFNRRKAEKAIISLDKINGNRPILGIIDCSGIMKRRNPMKV
jgi:hypothetical protein